MKKFCLTLDLKDDPGLIREYEQHHQNIPPAIVKSIRHSGIEKMEIFRLGTRLFMIMETGDAFSFETKAAMDAADAEVQNWETLMWTYQSPLKEAGPGEKWLLMDKIFDLPPAEDTKG